MGELERGRFVSWATEPDVADARIDEELMSMDTLLDAQDRYVLRKQKDKPN